MKKRGGDQNVDRKLLFLFSVHFLKFKKQYNISEWGLTRQIYQDTTNTPFLRNLVLAGDTLSEEEVMMLINASDRDGDGSLDFEEFVKIMMG